MIKIIYGHWNNTTFYAELFLANEDLLVIPFREISEFPKTYTSICRF